MKVKFSVAVLASVMLGALGTYTAQAVESNADLSDVVAAANEQSASVVDQATAQGATDEMQADFFGGPGHGGPGFGPHPGPGPIHGGPGFGPHPGPAPDPGHGGGWGPHPGPGPGPGWGPHPGPGPIHGGPGWGPHPGPIHGGPGWGHPYPVHGGAYPWPHWGHPWFPRPIYGWNWGAVRVVTCTAADSVGDEFPVTEDGYYGSVYEDRIQYIEDAAIDRCYEETNGDTTCHLLDCVPGY